MLRLGILLALVAVPLAAAAPKGPVVGDFLATDGSVEGAWVSFAWDAESVRGFAVGGHRLFDVEVDAEPSRTAIGRETQGARTEVRTPFYRLEALDVPDATVRIVADGELRLRFPERAALAVTRDGVAVDVDGRRGLVVGPSGPLRVDGATVVASGEARFVALTTPGGLAAHVAHAAGDRRLGAVVHVALGPDGLREAAATYGGVQVRTRALERGVEFEVSGAPGDGRVLAFALDPALFGGATDALDYRFDGAPLAEASSPEDALDPDDDGLAPERWAAADASGWRVLVSVPHYSVHTVAVQAFDAARGVSLALGVAAGAVLTALGAALLLRPR